MNAPSSQIAIGLQTDLYSGRLGLWYGPRAVWRLEEELGAMDTKKFAIATVGGGVVLFLTGFVFYGLLLKDFMEANSPPGLMKEMPDMVPLVLGELCIAAFLTLILSRWQGITSFAAGAKAGGMLGLLFAVGLNLVFYATMNMMEPVTILPDTLVNTVRMSLAGGVIGLVLGRS